jgi:hypothetical protein
MLSLVDLSISSQLVPAGFSLSPLRFTPAVSVAEASPQSKAFFSVELWALLCPVLLIPLKGNNVMGFALNNLSITQKKGNLESACVS